MEDALITVVGGLMLDAIARLFRKRNLVPAVVGAAVTVAGLAVLDPSSGLFVYIMTGLLGAGLAIPIAWTVRRRFEKRQAPPMP